MTRWTFASKILRAGLITCLAFLVATAPGLAQGNALEVAVKAAYLYKIAAFVTWPPATPSMPDTFNICVVGNDPFGDVLDRAVEGQTVADRPIVANRFGALPDKFDCQIMYISDSKAQPAAPVLAQVRGKPVLTVTDAANDPSARGIINFVIADNRVRFEIDDRAAAENRLTISSKLLSLALIVRSGPPRVEDR